MGRSLRHEDVEPRLRGGFGRPYAFVERCASTQRLLAVDAPEGAVVVADEQTEGRGRLGRRWEAPAGTSLLFSLLLRPPVETARWPELSVVAGRAVAEAIADVTGLVATVKHPNDVQVGGSKVAGVLAEASEGRVVLGVGVNVSQRAGELPADSRTPPTSLELESGSTVDRAELLVQILHRLEGRYAAWIQS
jgi:BirA family biotin operon repressor/biotin-[acetyl-CoA-carboxylase] ligase